MKYFIAIVLICLCVSAKAQENISVSSFLPNVNDLTARVDVRKDNTGNPCALIKVVFPGQGVTFECGNIASMIVGEVSFHTNEYWVYLAAGLHGAKHLKVKHPNYPTIDIVFADYGFSALEPQNTYTLVLQKPKTEIVGVSYNKAGAGIISAFIPGLGQMTFKRSYTKGALILATEAIAVSGIFVCNNQSSKWKNKSQTADTASDKIAFMGKSDNWANVRTICLGAAAGIWIYNMVDILFAKPTIKKKNTAFTMQPYMNDDKQCGISMAYRF